MRRDLRIGVLAALFLAGCDKEKFCAEQLEGAREEAGTFDVTVTVNVVAYTADGEPIEGTCEETVTVSEGETPEINCEIQE